MGKKTQENRKKRGHRAWPSPPGTFHILIEKISYFVIRFLLNSSIVKSDDEIRNVNDKKI